MVWQRAHCSPVRAAVEGISEGASRRAGRWVFVVLLVVSAGAAAWAAEPMTEKDIARLRAASSVAVAPDGKRIAYTLNVPRDPFEEENGEAWVELHLIDEAGRSRPFVTGQVNVSRIAWMPDGSGIAFIAKRGADEHKSLYVIPVDGGEARRLLLRQADIRGFSFSPDGGKVAFLAKDKKEEKKEKLEEKGFNQEIFEEGWRLVRVWLAALGDEQSEPRALELEGSAADLRWSPGGNRLALTLAPTPLIDDSYMRKRVHIVDVETGEVIASVANPGKLGAMRWSPDSRHLAMISATDEHDPKEGRLMVVSAEGGVLRDLTPDYGGHVQSFAWMDAKTLLFTGDEGVWTRVVRVELDARQQEIVPAGGAVLTNVDVSRDGKVAVFLGQAPDHPAEVFRLRMGSGAPQRLSTSNLWLEEVRLAPQEVVSFEARDGLGLEGILIRPLDAREGRRYPLVMIVHGGPEAHHRNGWMSTYSRPAQVLAGKGFAVFFTNYRGSTGRGLEFSKMSQGDPAGREFDDLVDAVEHLIGTGLVEAKRVGITGGSYGGYATAWCSTYYSERFAAGVMFVGISDLVSKMTTSDIPNELFQVHLRMRPWDDWQRSLERSPIYHAARSRTPLLILHGKDDPRVFPGQSLELYRTLKLRSEAPVRLVYYPGEEHGNKKAAARLDYTLRLVRWMEHYLKGEGGEPPAYELDYGELPEEEAGAGEDGK
ncbi:MAG: S9 family peptidase [Acidobacteriota bacterium]